MTVANPPTTSATPSSRAAVSARVSRRAATRIGDADQQRMVPQPADLPHRDRAGGTPPTAQAGRRAGGAATAMPAASSARAHRLRHGQRIGGVAVQAEGVHRRT